MLRAIALRGAFSVAFLLIGGAAALYAQGTAAKPDTSLTKNELRRLYEQDQADRRQRPIDWKVVVEKDRQRRQRVRAMIEAEALRTADDFYHAAMIFQHGADSTDYLLARDLARQTVQRDSTHATALQLTAMAQDRYLWSIDVRQEALFWIG